MPSESSDPLNGTQPQPEEFVVDNLITALKNESVSEEQMQALREIVGSNSIASMNTHIEYYQTHLNGLTSYTDALKELS